MICLSFLGVFRKKTRPSEIGPYLTDFVIRPLSHHRSHPDLWHLEGLSPEALFEELFYLESFAVDYAVTLALGHSPRRQAVMGHFWNVLRRRMAEMGCPFALREYGPRQEAYREGIASHHSDPVAGVGSAFASLCGLDGEEALTEQAVTEFATTATAIVRLLMRFRVLEEA